LAKREPAALAAAADEHRGQIDFWKFCQWSFFRQWEKLRAYAHGQGIRIIGDAPIFVAYQSAETWARPDLFELDADGRQSVVAGVPPDYFSDTGQRWGNPLYRWDTHQRDDFAWWIERIRHSLGMVDILRIDHFVGFTRYWEIPVDEPTAERGRWLPSPGEALLEALVAALGTVPVIAEDLGIVTPDVHALRRRFGLPGMCVLQFAWGPDGDPAFLPHNHERDTVVYTGTHDNDTTLGWWNVLGEAEKHHLREYLSTDGLRIDEDLIRCALASVADTAIVPLQDWLGLGSEHRMNHPGRAEGNWGWRLCEEDIGDDLAPRMAHRCRLYGRERTSES
jgi:4-alpha-glucanotransferase